METRLNQFERGGVVHRGMRYEIFLRKRRDHDQRNPEASEGKVARLVCGRHDRSYAVWARDSDWPNMIVKAAAFIERFDHDSIFPRRAVHERIDQFGGKLCAQLDVAFWVLINTTAAGPVYLDSRFYVCDLRQSAILHVCKVLAQWNHIRMVSVEVGEIGEIRVPISGVDLP